MTKIMSCNSFIAYIVNSIVRKNSNCIIFIGGKSGNGKSYGSGKIGELVAQELIRMCFRDINTFDISNIIWNVKDLIKAVKDEKLPDYVIDGVTFQGKKLAKGSVIVIEEAGVNANSRQWHAVTNQALHFLSQTYRRNNYCTIFNAPDLSFIDVGVRKTIHIYLEATGIVPGQYAEFRVTVPFNDRHGVLDFKPFVVYDEETNTKQELYSIRLGLPSQEFIDKYEILKKQFNDKLYAKLDRMINTMERKAEKEASKEDAQNLADGIITTEQEGPKGVQPGDVV